MSRRWTRNNSPMFFNYKRKTLKCRLCKQERNWVDMTNRCRPCRKKLKQCKKAVKDQPSKEGHNRRNVNFIACRHGFSSRLPHEVYYCDICQASWCESCNAEKDKREFHAGLPKWPDSLTEEEARSV